ncbi:uncharacterized protein [Clytia hemisphaerica]|uniref:uncharacterized protein n=1 Tax=Clytia hemisphaerica TaxID=252671 RepID=UPI0034D61A6E
MYFALFGVPEEIAADGGPPFDSHDYKAFLKQWRIRQRLSSAYYAQSNGRAEAGVKTAKRILLGNIDPRTGKLDNESAVKALMTHRNTPCQLTAISPAIALFGRPIRDHLPTSNMKLRTEWQEIASKREVALAKRHLVKPPQETTKELPPLNIGDSVQIQNQNGNQPTNGTALDSSPKPSQTANIASSSMAAATPPGGTEGSSNRSFPCAVRTSTTCQVRLRKSHPQKRPLHPNSRKTSKPRTPLKNPKSEMTQHRQDEMPAQQHTMYNPDVVLDNEEHHAPSLQR